MAAYKVSANFVQLEIYEYLQWDVPKWNVINIRPALLLFLSADRRTGMANLTWAYCILLFPAHQQSFGSVTGANWVEWSLSLMSPEVSDDSITHDNSVTHSWGSSINIQITSWWLVSARTTYVSAHCLTIRPVGKPSLFIIISRNCRVVLMCMLIKILGKQFFIMLQLNSTCVPGSVTWLTT